MKQETTTSISRGSSLERGFVDIVYNQISTTLSDFMGFVFERVCTQYMWRLLEKIKTEIVFNELGRWWGNNQYRKQESEIDILAISKDGMIFGECKWTNSKVNRAVLEELVEKSKVFIAEKKYYYLFSKRGFTGDNVKELTNVKLISFDDMNDY